MVARHKINLEGSTLASLARRPEFVREFPFLAPLAGLSCSSCGQAGARNRAAFETAKQSLNALSREQKQKFKSMLNTRRVVFRLARSGKRAVIEF